METQISEMFASVTKLPASRTGKKLFKSKANQSICCNAHYCYHVCVHKKFSHMHKIFIQLQNLITHSKTLSQAQNITLIYPYLIAHVAHPSVSQYTHCMSVSVITFDSLVVEVTCLLSVWSAPSVSSPVDCPGEALVFLRSLLDLHWISVSRPADSDEGFTVKYLTALYSAAVVNVFYRAIGQLGE